MRWRVMIGNVLSRRYYYEGTTMRSILPERDISKIVVATWYYYEGSIMRYYTDNVTK